MSSLPQQINQALKRGLDYLEQKQAADGSFKSWSFSPTAWPLTNHNHFTPPNIPSRVTIFQQALIVTCFKTIKTHVPQLKIKPLSTATKFLQTQKSGKWTFNYWSRQSQIAQQQPFPDDLDDSACAWAALYQAAPKHISGQVLAKISQILIQQEVKVGGPYRTWLVPTSAGAEWQDVDLAVNFNLAYFLSLQQIKLPNLKQLAKTAILNHDYHSHYYPEPLVVKYLLSRWYQGPLSTQLRQQILKEKEESSIYPAATSLMLSGLLRLNASKNLTNELQMLLALQRKSGAWPVFPLCLDPAVSGEPRFAGSPAFSTALALEALALIKSKFEDKSCFFPDQNETEFKTRVVSQLKQEIEVLPPALSQALSATFNQCLSLDEKHDISLFGWHFWQNLKPQYKKQLANGDELTFKLGVANWWGWLAYALYDQLCDEQPASPTLLPIANQALFQFSKTLTQLSSGSNQSNQKFVVEIMTTLNQAQQLELNQARVQIQNDSIIFPQELPSYQPLTRIADKSIAHCLGPLIVLQHLNFKPYHPAHQTWLAFCYHHLAAKQLSDDLHDWEEDLAKGHLSPVVTAILNSEAFQNRIKLKLSSATWAQLRRIFWQKILRQMLEKLQNQLKLAHQALLQNPCLDDISHWQKQLNKLDKMAKETIVEQKAAHSFIKEIKKGAQK